MKNEDSSKNEAEMTRLSSVQVKDIDEASLRLYDDELKKKIGLTLFQVGCRASGVSEKRVSPILNSCRIGVIPISAGKGVIEGFVEAVSKIISHIGFTCFFTERRDVAGIKEACQKGAKVIFMADDECFIALNLSQCQVVDNSEATARGYVAALESMVAGLKEKEVLVIGAGRVGRNALISLKERRAKPGVYDINIEKAEECAHALGVRLEKDLKKALKKYWILLDASPALSLIRKEDLKDWTAIAACGIPLGITPKAYSFLRHRIIHDPLQIGVATMAVMACWRKRGRKQRGGRSERSHGF